MRSFSIWPSAAVAVFLAACGGGPPAATPSSAPTSAAAAPANVASGSWNDVLAGAKSEGQVVVLSQGGSAIAEALTAGFKQKYPDVKLDFTGATGAEIANKLLTERQAGKYTVDVVVHGTTTFITSLMPSGALDPLQPALVGPDDSEPKQWRDGYDFADDAGKYDLIFTGGVKVPMIYNPKLMSPADVTSYKDLLDPKWKGKIAMIDPRLAGAGLASATFWYVTPGLGKDFLDKFFTQQQVMLTPDDRQLTDWVGQGKYVIGLAAQDFSALDLKQRGVPIELLPAEGVKEGTYLTAAWGSAGLVNRAPHPNAARVYLNWILSKQGQEDVSKASGYPSRRLDTSNAGLRDSVIPKSGVNYQDNSKEQYVKLKDEIIAYLKPLIPAS